MGPGGRKPAPTLPTAEALAAAGMWGGKATPGAPGTRAPRRPLPRRPPAALRPGPAPGCGGGRGCGPGGGSGPTPQSAEPKPRGAATTMASWPPAAPRRPPARPRGPTAAARGGPSPALADKGRPGPGAAVSQPPPRQSRPGRAASILAPRPPPPPPPPGPAPPQAPSPPGLIPRARLGRAMAVGLRLGAEAAGWRRIARRRRGC